MSGESLQVTILIAALDEEAWITHAVRVARASLDATQTTGEVIVCDGGSADRTCDLARRAGAQVIATSPGRPTQFNEGLERARGDVVLFLHADALCLPRVVLSILDAMDQGAVGGWFQIDILPERGTHTNSLRLISWGINLRTRLFTTATADQAIFASRQLLLDLGGMPDIPLMEGNALARMLRERGRVAVLGPLLRISGRRWETHGVWKTTATMYGLRAAHMLGVSPHTLARFWRDRAPR